MQDLSNSEGVRIEVKRKERELAPRECLYAQAGDKPKLELENVHLVYDNHVYNPGDHVEVVEYDEVVVKADIRNNTGTGDAYVALLIVGFELEQGQVATLEQTKGKVLRDGERKDFRVSFIMGRETWPIIVEAIHFVGIGKPLCLMDQSEPITVVPKGVAGEPRWGYVSEPKWAGNEEVVIEYRMRDPRIEQWGGGDRYTYRPYLSLDSKPAIRGMPLSPNHLGGEFRIPKSRLDKLGYTARLELKETDRERGTERVVGKVTREILREEEESKFIVRTPRDENISVVEITRVPIFGFNMINPASLLLNLVLECKSKPCTFTLTEADKLVEGKEYAFISSRSINPGITAMITVPDESVYKFKGVKELEVVPITNQVAAYLCTALGEEPGTKGCIDLIMEFIDPYFVANVISKAVRGKNLLDEPAEAGPIDYFFCALTMAIPVVPVGGLGRKLFSKLIKKSVKADGSVSALGKWIEANQGLMYRGIIKGSEADIDQALRLLDQATDMIDNTPDQKAMLEKAELAFRTCESNSPMGHTTALERAKTAMNAVEESTTKVGGDANDAKRILDRSGVVRNVGIMNLDKFIDDLVWVGDDISTDVLRKDWHYFIHSDEFATKFDDLDEMGMRKVEELIKANSQLGLIEYLEQLPREISYDNMYRLNNALRPWERALKEGTELFPTADHTHQDLLDQLLKVSTFISILEDSADRMVFRVILTTPGFCGWINHLEGKEIMRARSELFFKKLDISNDDWFIKTFLIHLEGTPKWTDSKTGDIWLHLKVDNLSVWDELLETWHSKFLDAGLDANAAFKTSLFGRFKEGVVALEGLNKVIDQSSPVRAFLDSDEWSHAISRYILSCDAENIAPKLEERLRTPFDIYDHFLLSTDSQFKRAMDISGFNWHSVFFKNMEELADIYTNWIHRFEKRMGHEAAWDMLYQTGIATEWHLIDLYNTLQRRLPLSTEPIRQYLIDNRIFMKVMAMMSRDLKDLKYAIENMNLEYVIDIIEKSPMLIPFNTKGFLAGRTHAFDILTAGLGITAAVEAFTDYGITDKLKDLVAQFPKEVESYTYQVIATKDWVSDNLAALMHSIVTFGGSTSSVTETGLADIDDLANDENALRSAFESGSDTGFRTANTEYANDVASLKTFIDSNASALSREGVYDTFMYAYETHKDILAAAQRYEGGEAIDGAIALAESTIPLDIYIAKPTTFSMVIVNTGHIPAQYQVTVTFEGVSTPYREEFTSSRTATIEPGNSGVADAEVNISSRAIPEGVDVANYDIYTKLEAV